MTDGVTGRLGSDFGGQSLILRSLRLACQKSNKPTKDTPIKNYTT